MATTKFSVRLDNDLKKQSEALYGELGVNLTTARIDEPNKETLLALLEAEKISSDPNTKGLDVLDALKELKNK